MGNERRERVALSERALRIIITVVVGVTRRHAEGDEGEREGDGRPGGREQEEEEREKDDGGDDDERPLPGGWKRVYLPTAGTHRRHRGRT